MQFLLKLEHYKRDKAARHQTKCAVINEVKLFLTVYYRRYYCKFLTLSNQTSCYKIKCIKMTFDLSAKVAFVGLQNPFEPRHQISNNVVCATSKASDQPAHTGCLIRAFASCLNILWLLSY